MHKKSSITDSELEVLKELWAKPAQTARELTDKLLQKTDWSEPTIKTLLLRLLQKKAVTRHNQGKVFIYSAAVSCEEYRYMAGKSLIDRLFNGMTGELLTCLVRHKKMSQTEIETLKKLLDEANSK